MVVIFVPVVTKSKSSLAPQVEVLACRLLLAANDGFSDVGAVIRRRWVRLLVRLASPQDRVDSIWDLEWMHSGTAAYELLYRILGV